MVLVDFFVGISLVARWFSGEMVGGKMVWWQDGLVVIWFGGEMVWWQDGLVARWFGGN